MISTSLFAKVVVVSATVLLWPLPLAARVTEVGAQRNATMELLRYLRGLPVAKEKVLPLVDGEVLLDTVVIVSGVQEVNEALQTVSIHGMIEFVWHDPALVWNPADYHDVDSAELTAADVWVPDVLTSSFESHILTVLTKLNVSSNGTIVARAMLSRMETPCVMDLSLFPYDEYTCPVLFASYSGFLRWRINVLHSGFSSEERGDYVAPSSWDLGPLTAYVGRVTGFDREVATVMISMKRRTTFYTICLVYPMVITSYMNTFVFLLPLRSGERISYLVTLSVSTSVFIGFFADVMPRGLNNVPSTMKILIGVIVQSVLVLLATILVQHQQQHQDHQRQDDNNHHQQQEERFKNLPHADDVKRIDVHPGPLDPALKKSPGAKKGRGFEPFNVRVGDAAWAGGDKVGAKKSGGGGEGGGGRRGGGEGRGGDGLEVTAERLNRVFFALFVVSNSAIILGLRLLPNVESY